MVVHRLALASILSSIFWSSGARAEAGLTLEGAVKLALTNNERALKAPLRVKAAEGQLERARAAFLPTLVASANGSLSGTPDRNGNIVSAGGALTLNQTLLNVPAFPLYAQARHQLESERWGAVDDVRALAYDTARSFFVVLTTEQLLEAANRRLERARAEQQTAEARASAQLASVNDATRARVETSAAARSVVAAEANVTRAYLDLGFLVGRPVKPPLIAPSSTTRAAESGGPRADEAARTAEARRPDLRSLHERAEALRQAEKEPLYRLAPSLSASAQLRMTVDPVAPADVLDESAQLTLTWTLYDAGVRYADRKTRAAQARSAELDERQLRRSIATDIDIAAAAGALRTAQLNLRDSSVRAPMEGVIQTRTIETGQYVQPGYVMATLLRSEPLLLRFEVEPRDAPRIKPGTTATFTMRETQRTFTAKVTLIAGAADSTTHMVPVTAEVVDEDHKYWLRPGSFCDVTLDLSAQRDAPIIPRTAARAMDRGYVAYVVEGDVATERALTLGMSTKDGWVEVRSSLAAGDLLVVRGAEALSEGAKVRVTKVSPESLAKDAQPSPRRAPSAEPPAASASAGDKP